MSATADRTRESSRLPRRVRALIAAQLAGATALALLAVIRGGAFGDPWAVAPLALVFALAGFFGMTLEFHRYRFTFTPAEAVLAVGFFFVGPIGLAVAAAVGECVNMVVQRHGTLKTAFNVSNRLAATTAAGVAFAVFGRADVHEAAAWGAALGAALCFSVLDVVSTSAVLSIVEETRFHDVFVRSASTGLLATLTAAPVGLVALDLAEHGPFVPLLLAPIAIAVALNARVRRRAARRAPPVRAAVRVVGAHCEPRRPRRLAPRAGGGDKVPRHGHGGPLLCHRRDRRMARRARG